MSHILYYLPLRARAECIRMILSYGEIPYEDVVMDFETWSTMKEKGDLFRNGQVPAMTLPSGLNIVQSGSIIRYVAKLANCYPDDIERVAVADMALEMGMEMNPINPILNWFTVDSESYNSTYNSYFGSLDSRLVALTGMLGSDRYFGGEAVCYADFLIFHILDNTLLVKSDSLTTYPHLLQWMARMHMIPQLREYLQRRPGPPLVGREGSFIRTLGTHL